MSISDSSINSPQHYGAPQLQHTFYNSVAIFVPLQIKHSSIQCPQKPRMNSSIWTGFGHLTNFGTMRPRSFTFSAVSACISSQFSATIVTTRSYVFYCIRVRYVSRFNQTIGFIIPTLLVFLQLKYLTNDNRTPFTTHPYTMGVAVFSAFMYYLACIMHLKYSLRQFSDLSGSCMVWFGDISVASLMSIFLPDLARPLLYVVVGLISGSEFLQKLFVEETGGAFWVQRRCIRRFWNNLGRFLNKPQLEGNWCLQ